MRCAKYTGMIEANTTNVATIDSNQSKFNIIGVINTGIAISRDAVVATDGDTQRIANFLNRNTQGRRAFSIYRNQQFRFV